MVQAQGIMTRAVVDLIGHIGAAILAESMPKRRIHTRPRAISALPVRHPNKRGPLGPTVLENEGFREGHESRTPGPVAPQGDVVSCRRKRPGKEKVATARKFSQIVL